MQRNGHENSFSNLRWLFLSVAIFFAQMYVVETEWDHLGTDVGIGGRLWVGLLMESFFFLWLWRRRVDNVEGVG
jgi:hypothetical protein